jgi:hypothetical protein
MANAAYEPPDDFSPGQQIIEHQQRPAALDNGGSRLTAVSVASFAGQLLPPRAGRNHDVKKS